MSSSAAASSPYKNFGGDIFKYVVDQTGKLISLPATFAMEGFKDEWDPDIPNTNESYVFRLNLLQDVWAFLYRPHGHALWLAGPTGSGKTSVVTELAGRLNWPVQNVTCNGRLEFSDLTGSQTLVSRPGSSAPEVQFQYGPLAKAMKYGHILVLNEIDLVNPDQLAGLNDVLEGRPLVITSNGGEVIHPHEKFRVVATANSRGIGDDTGAYSGVQTQNIAALDRYRVLIVDYLSETQESAMLSRVLEGKVPNILVNAMVRIAGKIRRQFEEGSLSLTMSSRTLLFWGQLMLDYSMMPNATKKALELAFTNKLSSSEKQAIYLLCQQEIGGNLSWLD
jgi:cobaltochelatase CobS